MTYASSRKVGIRPRTGATTDTQPREVEQVPVDAVAPPTTTAGGDQAAGARQVVGTPATQEPQPGQPGPRLARAGAAVIDASEALPYLVRGMISSIEDFGEHLGLRRHVEAQLRQLEGRLADVERLSAAVIADTEFLLGFASDDTAPLEGFQHSLSIEFGRLQAAAQEHATQALLAGRREAADRFLDLATATARHAGTVPTTAADAPATDSSEAAAARDKAALVGRSRLDQAADLATEQLTTPERYPQFTNALLQGLRVLSIGFAAGTLGAILSPMLTLTAGAMTVLRGIVQAVRSEKRERELARLKVELSDEELRSLAEQGEESAQQDGRAASTLQVSGVGAMIAGVLAIVGASIPPVAIVAMLLGGLGLAWMARRWLKARKKKQQRIEDAGSLVIDAYFDGDAEERREARKLLAQANRKVLERLEQRSVTVVDNPIHQALARRAEQREEPGAGGPGSSGAAEEAGGQREIGRRKDNADVRQAMQKGLAGKVGRVLREREKGELATLSDQLLARLLDPAPRTAVETDALLRGFGLDTSALREQTTGGDKQRKKARQKVYYTLKKAVM